MERDRKKEYKKLKEEILEKSVFISKKYYDSWGSTLDPEECKSREDAGANAIKIQAHFSGAITEHYFDDFDKKLKICFILKEPWTENRLNDNVLKGCNQSEKYADPELSFFGNDFPPTYKRIIKVAYNLSKDNSSYEEITEETEKEALNIFRNNVCIINVNNFPAKAKDDTSSNKFIEEWAEKDENRSLIHRQLDLYKPDIIVIGGKQIHQFLRLGDNQTVSLGTEKPIILNNIEPAVLEKYFPNCYGKVFGDHNWVYANADSIFINAYHPSLSMTDCDYYKYIKLVYQAYVNKEAPFNNEKSGLKNSPNSIF